MFHGAAKVSGAGGGDCGIVIIDNKYPIQSLIEKWKENDIEYLPFEVEED